MSTLVFLSNLSSKFYTYNTDREPGVKSVYVYFDGDLCGTSRSREDVGGIYIRFCFCFIIIGSW